MSRWGGRRPALDGAIMAIWRALLAGERASAEVKAELIAMGHARITVDRARAQMIEHGQIQVRHVGRQTYWSLTR